MSAGQEEVPETGEKLDKKEVEETEDDPLVIDEEKGKANDAVEEASTNNDEDNEKEFEPTVDMLMNEFDDEATIDEEEALGQDDEDELSALQNEQDMPIEELLKMYGYNNSQSQTKDEDTKEEEANKIEPVDVESKESKSGEEEKGEPSKESKESVPETNVEEEPRGEKRSSSSPPPSKKARSELAKFYEATVEGRSLRSSAGVVEEEEEEEEEEEVDETKDYSWKKTIMIGPTYQVSVFCLMVISVGN